MFSENKWEGFRVIIHKKYTLKRTNKLNVWLQFIKPLTQNCQDSTFFTTAERSLDFERCLL